METVADECTRYQMIDELRPLCEAAGLELRRSNDTHFQLMHEGIAVVDVWPSRNKYRRVTAHPDAHAMVGKARDAIQLAVNCANGKHPKPCSPKNAIAREGNLRDEFACAALLAYGIDNYIDRDAPHPFKWDGMTDDCYRIADAMLRSREKADLTIKQERANGSDGS
jgi:hypothetical protein